MSGSVYGRFNELLERGMTPPEHLGWDEEKGVFGLCVVADVEPDEDGIQPIMRLADVPDSVAADLILVHGNRHFKRRCVTLDELLEETE